MNSGYSFEDGECSITIDYGSYSFEETSYLTRNLPCYPDEVGEQVSASWSEQTIIGRTGTLTAYTGTSDTQASFSFDLHREMSILGKRDDNTTNIDYLIRLIKSGCYPKYGVSMLEPPITTWKFGDMIITGRMMSVGSTWKKPIIDKKYTVCSLSINMVGVSRYILGSDQILGRGPNSLASPRGNEIR